MSIATKKIFKETLHFIHGEYFEATHPRHESWEMDFQSILIWSSIFSSFEKVFEILLKNHSTRRKTYPHAVLLYMIQKSSWSFRSLPDGSINFRVQKLTYFSTELKRNAVAVFSAVTKTLPGVPHAFSLNCMIFYAEVLHEYVVDVDQRCFHLVARRSNWRD